MKKSMSLGSRSWRHALFCALVYTILRFTRYRALLSADADRTFVNGLRKISGRATGASSICLATNVCFAAACFSLCTLDYVVAPLFVWLDQVCQSDIVQIIIDQLV